MLLNIRLLLIIELPLIIELMLCDWILIRKFLFFATFLVHLSDGINVLILNLRYVIYVIFWLLLVAGTDHKLIQQRLNFFEYFVLVYHALLPNLGYKIGQAWLKIYPILTHLALVIFEHFKHPILVIFIIYCRLY